MSATTYSSSSRRNAALDGPSQALVLRLALAVIVLLFTRSMFGAELTAPSNATAGHSATLHSSSGGTLILVAPDHASKRKVESGDVMIPAEEMHAAGLYIAILGDTSVHFMVAPAEANAVNFLARPSRVPVGRAGAVSGVAFVFDAFNNLVVVPTTVHFTLAIDGAAPVARQVQSIEGVAWTRMDSGRTAGAAQFVASLDGEDSAVHRVVRQVASEPCNLHFTAQRSERAIEVKTSPIKDCTGNPVPDGTIITFIQTDSSGRSTVDARVKRGIAKAEMPLSEQATISVASGVVTGNEVRIGGAR